MSGSLSHGTNKASTSYPLNTMIFSGLPERGWEDYFYRSVDEIRSPNKAVARWLTGTLE